MDPEVPDRTRLTAQRLLSTRTCFTLSGQADKACGTLRAKRHQLRLVLKGRITDHHRYMLNELMADHDRIEAKILRLETEIADRMTPYAGAIERLMTIPGTQADYCLVDRR